MTRITRIFDGHRGELFLCVLITKGSGIHFWRLGPNKMACENKLGGLNRVVGIRLLKTVMWIYLSLGILIILAIGFGLFVLPLISPDKGPSTEALDLMEKILLWWGIILLPFLKLGQMLVKRHQREKKVI